MQASGNCMRNCQAIAPSPAGVKSGGRAWLRRPWATAGPGQAIHSDQAPLVWRAPEGPEGTGGLRGAAPNEVRTPSLAGGRARGPLTATSLARLEAAAWPAGPGRASRRRAERSSRRGRRAGGQATRRPEIRRGHRQRKPPLCGIAKGAGISRPLARVPSLVHEGHLDATHQRGDDVVEHGSQRR